MVNLEPIIGWAATVVLAINMAPQVIETFYYKSSADISITFLALNLLACALFIWWGTYLSEGILQIVVSNVLVAICDILLLISKFLYKEVKLSDAEKSTIV